ncbi:MAG: TonB family protein [Gallionella sp.]
MATAEAMNSFAIQPMSAIPGSVDSPLRDWSPVVAVVVLAHVSLLWLWAVSPSLPKSLRHDMSVSIAIQISPQAVQARPEQKIKPVEPQPVASRPVEPQQPTVQDMTPVSPVETSAPAGVENTASTQPADVPPGPPDREPDYHAAYLNNPKPSYPMVARRMGWQGRVVLNVEVLVSGFPGQIVLHQSSGHEVLDNVALNTVRTWRFVPARHNGEAVTRRFLVPIPFVLNEDS